MRRPTRARALARPRLAFLSVDRLEDRRMLSTVPAVGPQPVDAASRTFLPMYEVTPLASSTPPSGAYTPSQIAQAYNFNAISFGSAKGDGSGQTIAIVDAYSDPNIQSDLNTFDAQFNVPAATVTQVNENGGTSLPSADSSGGWEMEEALDVEWAHAMAPGARIILVAASSSSDTDLLAGVKYASTVASVVSMSWGGGEFSSESNYDSYFSKAGVTFVASSGDSGAPISWPAASPNVVAVGGTALSVASGSTYGSESGWGGSGGGPSAYESQPSYQSGVVTQTTKRANPDVAYDANPGTGFAIYDSVPDNGTTYGWLQIGGTSAGAPQWAALFAIADQGRALSGLSPLNSTGAQQVQTTLYANTTTGDFHDVTTGTSGGSPNYSAGAGYDYVTGIGTPVANLVVQSLVGTAVAPAVDHLVVASSPTSTVAGNALSVTITADTSSGAVDAGYTGTVQLGSSDVQAGLPSSYTFTAADKGSHTFTVILRTAGSQTVKATDTTTNAGTVTTPAIAVSPAAASQFLISGLASTATAGTAQSFTVTAEDPYGNVVTGYTGTVSFSSNDTTATLPGSYTFTTADAGKHAFSVTFGTAGTRALTVSTASPTSFSATQSNIVVSPSAPTTLTAASISTGQINLAWTGATGATGYTIQRSLGSTGTWTTVATVAAGTTSYSDTGLSAGTSYSYRVSANGGNNSGYSNTASATTASATAPAPTPAPSSTTYTVFGNTTPTVNGYVGGPYDVGMQFESSVAGVITGVRFYEQTPMAGYTHVGYLWSSTGQLLASATFTGETGSGWQQVTFSNPVAIAANTVYVASYSSGGGLIAITTGTFSAPVTNGPLTALAGNSFLSFTNSTFPTSSTKGMNFWVDVLFSPSSTSSLSTSHATTSTPSTTGYVAPSGSTSRVVAIPAAPSTPTVATSPVRAHVSTVVPQATLAASFRRYFFGA